MITSESYVSNLYADDLVDFPRQRKVISRQLFRSITACLERIMDFITGATSILAAYFIQSHSGAYTQYPVQKLLGVSCLQGLFVILLLQRDRAYEHSGSLLRIRETERAIRTSMQSLLLLLLANSILNLGLSHAVLLIASGLTPVLLITQKQLLFSVVRFLHAKGHGIERVVVYGAGETGRRIVTSLLYSPRLGLRPVAVISDESAPSSGCMFELGYRRCHSVPVQQGPITPAVLKSLRCNLLIVAMTGTLSEKLTEVIQVAKQAGATVAFPPELPAQERQWAGTLDVDGVLLASTSEPLTPRHYAIAKRIVDLVLSTLLLIILAPFLCLIALLIRLGSRGPSLFVQKRVGLNGKLFDMYKFRSMRTSSPQYDVSPTESSDPRITGLGRLLRRTSLDELPQLMNVVLGHMALVGPRPEMPFIVERYSTQHRRRLQVIPGITGLWQLSADRAFHIHENIQYDLYYIRHRTLFMDVAILIHTLIFAMCGGV